MIKFLAVVSVLTSAVLAQSSNTTASNLIPSGISTTCTTFLTGLNKDTSMSTCLTSLIDATSAYLPGGNATSSPTKSQVMSTLNNLCSTTMTNKCPESSMRQMLTNFYSQCPELSSSPVASITQMYDVFYVLTPLRTALCSKDDNGDYCALNLPGSNGLKNATSSTTPSAIASQVASSTPLTPNLAFLESTNLPFLFIQPTNGAQAALQSNSQCTSCTRNVLTAYINWESSTPFGPGIRASGLLGSQQSLLDAVGNTCGSSFLSGVVQAAGGLSSGGPLSSGATQNVVFSSQGFFAIGMGLLVVVSRVASSAFFI